MTDKVTEYTMVKILRYIGNCLVTYNDDLYVSYERENVLMASSKKNY